MIEDQAMAHNGYLFALVYEIRDLRQQLGLCKLMCESNIHAFSDVELRAELRRRQKCAATGVESIALFRLTPTGARYGRE